MNHISKNDLILISEIGSKSNQIIVSGIDE